MREMVREACVRQRGARCGRGRSGLRPQAWEWEWEEVPLGLVPLTLAHHS